MTAFTPSRSKTYSTRRFNFALLLGAVLVGGLLFIAVFGPLIAPHDPIEANFILQDSEGNFIVPPFKPGQVEGFPLGSDFEGRDILSRLLWAIRPTMILAILVATMRLIIGTLLGFLEGWYGGVIADVITGAARIALGVPIIIMAIVVIYFFALRIETWVFVIALSISGWANTSRIVSERTRLIRFEPFIEASRALGASDIRLMWKHVLPQMRTLLLVTWAFEMSAVLLQLAELGFLGFFIGGGAIRLIPDPHSGAFFSELIAGQPELGQMLSAGWDNFFLVSWMPVQVGTAFFIAIFSFMMLGEGLKRHFAQVSGPRPIRYALRALSPAGASVSASGVTAISSGGHSPGRLSTPQRLILLGLGLLDLFVLFLATLAALDML